MSKLQLLLPQNKAASVFANYLIQKHAPICFFLTKDLDIIYINGDIGQLFSFPQADAALNLHNMIDDENQLEIFKTGVRKVLKSSKPNLYKDIILSKGGIRYQVEMLFEAVYTKASNEKVILIEVTILGQAKNKNNTTKTQQQQFKQRLYTLDYELREAKLYAQTYKEELTVKNEQLVSLKQDLQRKRDELTQKNESLELLREKNTSLRKKIDLVTSKLDAANMDIYNLIKSINTSIIFLDSKLKFRKFSTNTQKIFDINDDHIGQSIALISKQFDDLDLLKETSKVLEHLENIEREVCDINNNNYLMRIVPYKGSNNTILGVILTFEDIKDLLDARAESNLVSKKYKSIYELSKDVISIINKKGVIQTLNFPFANYSRKNLIGNNIYNFTNKEQGRKLETAINKAIKENVPSKVSLSLKTTDRQKCWMDVEVIPDPTQEELNNITLIMRDITDLKNSYKLLEESEERYRSIFENAHDQIMIVDKKGTIQTVNYAPQQTKEQLIGKCIYDFMNTDYAEMAKSVIDIVFESSSTGNYITEFENMGGNKMVLSVNASPIFIGGKIKYVSLISRDITFEKQIQKDYEDLSKNYELSVNSKARALESANNELAEINSFMDSFVHGAAHDLRTPLVTLKSYVELIPRLKGTKRDDALLLMKEATIRLESTLQGMVELIDFQSNSAHEIPTQDLYFEKLYSDVAFQLQHKIEEVKPQINYSFEKAPSIRYIKAFLNSILFNLISNAIKYRKLDTPCCIDISTQYEKDFIVLQVNDNGMGMDIERYGHLLFEPFKRLTSEREGIGIGLSIINKVVEKNGGRIEVQSRLTKGASFKVYLKQYEDK